MQTGNKKINQKLHRIYGFLRKKIEQIINKNNKLNNHNNKDMELNFVIPGHYKAKGSAEIGQQTDSTIDIIRVLGEDDEKENYFMLQDGRVLHESIILNQYEPINTVATQKDKVNNQAKLLKGIGEKSIDNPKQETFERKPFQSNIEQEYLAKHTNTSTPQESIHIAEIPTKSKEQEFTENILEKLKQPTLSKLNILVEIDIPYDLSKLQESIELLNLDKDIISDTIYQNINIYSIIIDSIKKSLVSNNEQFKPVNIHTIPRAEINNLQYQPKIVNYIDENILTEDIIVESKSNNIEVIAAITDIDNRFVELTKNLI